MDFSGIVAPESLTRCTSSIEGGFIRKAPSARARGHRVQRASRIDSVFEVAARLDGLGLNAENSVEHHRMEDRDVELANDGWNLRQCRFQRSRDREGAAAKPPGASQRDADGSATAMRELGAHAIAIVECFDLEDLARAILE